MLLYIYIVYTVWEDHHGHPPTSFRGPNETQEQICGDVTRWIYLCNVWQANNIWHDADNSDKDLSSSAQQAGELIHQSCDKALHSTELQRHKNLLRICFETYVSI